MEGKINKNSLPPDWVEKIELVEEDINRIRGKSKC
jgi:hypothetical protein